jgi:hypothetical protein
VGPARQRFGPKHKVVFQCGIPWQTAKAVPEPRPTNLGALAKHDKRLGAHPYRSLATPLRRLAFLFCTLVWGNSRLSL